MRPSLTPHKRLLPGVETKMELLEAAGHYAERPVERLTGEIPPNVKAVPLTRGQLAWIDKANWKSLSAFKWHAVPMGGKTGKFYARTAMMIDGRVRQVFMHRFILGVDGHWIVDHANGDSLDNRRANLRECRPANNNANRETRSLSGYRGVGRVKSGWRARLADRVIGTYSDPLAAARAYDAAAIELYGSFAKLNFPAGPDAQIRERLTNDFCAKSVSDNVKSRK